MTEVVVKLELDTAEAEGRIADLAAKVEDVVDELDLVALPGKVDSDAGHGCWGGFALGAIFTVLLTMALGSIVLPACGWQLDVRPTSAASAPSGHPMSSPERPQ